MRGCQGFPASILGSARKSGRKSLGQEPSNPLLFLSASKTSAWEPSHFTKKGWGSLVSDLLNFLPGPPQDKLRHTETPIPTWSPQDESYHDSDICIQTMRVLNRARVRLPSAPLFQVMSLQVVPQGWHCWEGSQPGTQKGARQPGFGSHLYHF